MLVPSELFLVDQILKSEGRRALEIEQLISLVLRLTDDVLLLELGPLRLLLVAVAAHWSSSKGISSVSICLTHALLHEGIPRATPRNIDFVRLR